MIKKKIKKEAIETIKFISVIFTVIVVLKFVFTYIPPLNQFSLFIIQTDSMDPVIAPNDMVIVKDLNPKEVEVGDIMAFRVDITGDGQDDVVVHYIAEIRTLNDQLIFKSKPEVSDLQDRWTLEEEDLVGVYQYQIKGVGKIFSFAQSWIGIIIIIIDITIIAIGYDIIFGEKKPKTILSQTE
jgi:signal peptidase